jgi:hypothetical protein
VYSRSASTESRIYIEEFKRNDGNLDQVQGFHRVKEQLSVEELEQRNTRSVGRISFEEILRYDFVEIQGTQGVRGRSTVSKESILGGIASQGAKMRPKIVGFAGGSSRVKTFEHLHKLFQVGRNQKIRRRSDNNRRICYWKRFGPLDKKPRKKR